VRGFCDSAYVLVCVLCFSYGGNVIPTVFSSFIFPFFTRAVSTFYSSNLWGVDSHSFRVKKRDGGGTLLTSPLSLNVLKFYYKCFFNGS